MKTKKLPWTRLILISAYLLLALPATSRAQDAPKTRASQSAQAGFDISIADGLFNLNGEPTEATLQNVVELLRSRHPEANIVIAPEVPPVLIQDLKIRATDLPMELEALRVASGDQFAWATAGGSQLDPRTHLPPSSAGQALYVLRRGPSVASQLRIEAFSLGGYFVTLPKKNDADENEALIAQKIEELKQMVDETVEIYRAINDNMYGRGSSRNTSLNMRFHRGANLVILIGDPESIEIASKVIGALPNVQRAGGRMGYGGIDFGGMSHGGRGTGLGLDPFMSGGGETYGGGYHGEEFGAGMEVPASRIEAPFPDEASSR